MGVFVAGPSGNNNGGPQTLNTDLGIASGGSIKKSGVTVGLTTDNVSGIIALGSLAKTNTAPKTPVNSVGIADRVTY